MTDGRLDEAAMLVNTAASISSRSKFIAMQHMPSVWTLRLASANDDAPATRGVNSNGWPHSLERDILVEGFTIQR